MQKEVGISEAAREEMARLAGSEAMRRDMEAVSSGRHNPFLKKGKVDVDAYIEFVTQFNDFINHEPKPFKPMIDRDMRL
ncbi:MAG: hypothetical protein HGA78_06335 [Nitrospirales bacterium]|nr:hypothetical protein [Nitrospirales bacterium]